MKTIAIRVPDELFDRVKGKLLGSDQTLTAYIQNLMSHDLKLDADKPSQEKAERTLSFRLSVKEYELLKNTAEMWGRSIKSMMKEFIKCDVDRSYEIKGFQKGEYLGECRTVTFQVSPQFFRKIKERQFGLGMTTQDYMRALVRCMTHSA